MKKLFLLFLLIPTLSFGADMPVKWDASPGASGYRIEQCLTAPETGPWTILKDVPGGAIVNTVITVPDQGTIYLRLVPYNANGAIPRTSAGAWYNRTLSLPGEGIGFSVP